MCGMAPRLIVTAPSTNIQQVVYDDATGDLFVQFVRKGTAPYRFRQVPINAAEGFQQANSAGQYFRGTILHQFDHEVISDFPTDF
jgi:hypothetical protein